MRCWCVGGSSDGDSDNERIVCYVKGELQEVKRLWRGLFLL